MRYQAVIFDLFGTLVHSFTRREYDQVNAQMAAAVRVPYPEFWRLMGETYQDSCLGRYSSYEDLVSDVCCRAGVPANLTQITQAAIFHYEFIAKAIVPEPEVLEALDRLKKRGLRLGLISDCGPSVPLLFPQSPLARVLAARGDRQLYSSAFGPDCLISIFARKLQSSLITPWSRRANCYKGQKHAARLNLQTPVRLN